MAPSQKRLEHQCVNDVKRNKQIPTVQFKLKLTFLFLKNTEWAEIITLKKKKFNSIQYISVSTSYLILAVSVWSSIKSIVLHNPGLFTSGFARFNDYSRSFMSFSYFKHFTEHVKCKVQIFTWEICMCTKKLFIMKEAQMYYLHSYSNTSRLFCHVSQFMWYRYITLREGGVFLQFYMVYMLFLGPTVC